MTNDSTCNYELHLKPEYEQHQMRDQSGRKYQST